MIGSTLFTFIKGSTFMQTMCNDVVAVVKAMYEDSPPAIVLVGHRSCSLSLSPMFLIFTISLLGMDGYI